MQPVCLELGALEAVWTQVRQNFPQGGVRKQSWTEFKSTGSELEILPRSYPYLGALLHPPWPHLCKSTAVPPPRVSLRGLKERIPLAPRTKNHRPVSTFAQPQSLKNLNELGRKSSLKFRVSTEELGSSIRPGNTLDPVVRAALGPADSSRSSRGKGPFTVFIKWHH